MQRMPAGARGCSMPPTGRWDRLAARHSKDYLPPETAPEREEAGFRCASVRPQPLMCLGERAEHRDQTLK